MKARYAMRDSHGQFGSTDSWETSGLARFRIS